VTAVQTRYRNKKFTKERIHLDGHGYENCVFWECLIVLERGETEIRSCQFQKCQILLLGQALKIAKILQTFLGDKPLRVLDFAEPGIFGEEGKSPGAEDDRPHAREAKDGD
jgi:hypothetical protein